MQTLDPPRFSFAPPAQEIGRCILWTRFEREDGAIEAIDYRPVVPPVRLAPQPPELVH
jgi:hypothetical protein